MTKKNYLLNPVAALPDRWQLTSGIIIFVLSVLICLNWHVVNDGILHATYAQLQSIAFLLVSNVAVILLPALLLFFTGRYFNKSTRLIDILNTVLFSRLPLVISYVIFFAMVNPHELNQLQTKPPGEISRDTLNHISFISLLIIPFFVYSLVILINGYKTSMNAKKPVHYLCMVITIIISEVVYRSLIFPFLYD